MKNLITAIESLLPLLEGTQASQSEAFKEVCYQVYLYKMKKPEVNEPIIDRNNFKYENIQEDEDVIKANEIIYGFYNPELFYCGMFNGKKIGLMNVDHLNDIPLVNPTQAIKLMTK